ncbi:liprin-beta-1-like [Tropilaelaps mercedesae]|uniref:Liprin-beta-1-like n=1 Tax=Tropilaelaps mercedesae TaxID=418985 RepID=A0A1V9X771_9ACAR|nr:liprin-beta-1-like [Tropilaelaps mercedesae]
MSSSFRISPLPPKESSPGLADASQVLAAALKEMDSIIASAEVDTTQDTANVYRNSRDMVGVRDHRNSYGNALYRSLERPSKNCSRSPYARLEPAKPVVLESPVYRESPASATVLASTTTSDGASGGDMSDLSELMTLRKKNIDLTKELFEMQQALAMQRAETESLSQELHRRRAQLEAAEEQLAIEVRMRKKAESERLQLMTDLPAMKLHLMRSEKERIELTTRLKSLQSGFQRTLSNLTAADLSGLRSGTPTRTGHPNSDKPPLPRPNMSPVFSNTIAASPSAQRRANDDRFQRFPQAMYSTLPKNYKPPAGIGKPDKSGAVNLSGSNTANVNDAFRGNGELKALEARSTSAPELNNPDRAVNIKGSTNGTTPTQPIISHTSAPRKIMKLFGKLSRSNSASNSSIGSFKRNTSTRATAMPRLCGWKSNEHMKRPLVEWDKKCIASFFQQLDLYDLYDSHLLAVHTGEALVQLIRSDSFQSTIKHPLHKRKLLLAIEVFAQNDSLLKSAICLDTKWALSWLDDLGLPQYTDAFQEAQVDGLILNSMTLEDAGILKINSQLALLSLKWGIYVLRSTNFDPGCLKRRSSDLKTKETIDEVTLWTNHRLMQWLRDIDLAEYAPNLRGSGIHGALLVYEDSLGEKLLAELLNIAPAKTLLRKHLTQQLKQLLGDAIIQRKRAAEATSSAPLSPSTKIKFPKGTLGRRSKKKCDQTLVCPHDLVGSLPSGCNDSMTTSISTAMTSSTHSSLSSNSTL